MPKLRHFGWFSLFSSLKSFKNPINHQDWNEFNCVVVSDGQNTKVECAAAIFTPQFYDGGCLRPEWRTLFDDWVVKVDRNLGQKCAGHYSSDFYPSQSFKREASPVDICDLTMNLCAMPFYLTLNGLGASFSSLYHKVALMQCKNHLRSHWYTIHLHTHALLLTVFENHRKSLIQHCERRELRLHFEWTKVH